MLFPLLAFALTEVSSLSVPPSSLVWPFHGTSGANGVGGWASSEVPLGAQLPFSSMRLGPDTSVCWEGIDWWLIYNHYGGYFYNDSCIRAFSHTHVQGAGLGDGGAVGVMMTRPTLQLTPLVINASLLPNNFNQAPYRALFDHSQETAAPGYYSVNLPSISTRIDLTATQRTGFTRFMCSDDGASHPCVLWVDACHRNHDHPCAPGTVTLRAPADNSTAWLVEVDTQENGSFGGDCGGVPVFITLTVNSPPGALLGAGRWVDGGVVSGLGTSSSNGTLGSLGVYFVFQAPTSTSNALEVEVRSAVSHVSQGWEDSSPPVHGAAGNLMVEQANGTLGFDAIASAASAAWDDALGAITVNDVGYTQGEWEGHVRGLEAGVKGNSAHVQRMRALLTPQTPSAGLEFSLNVQRALLAAQRAAAVHLNLSSSFFFFSNTTLTAEDSATIAAFLASHPSPAYLQASLPSSIPSLGLPPAPRGLPPAQRLSSFYSSLYHALAAPSIYSDSDGRYMPVGGGAATTVTWTSGSDPTTGAPLPGVWMSDLSLWDVYRSQTPLLALIAPTAASNLFFSSIADFNATGKPPHWVFASCETGCMPGSHGLAVLADFLSKGVPGPSPQLVLQAAIAGLSAQDGGEYDTLGYIPFESDEECASLTLDFAFDDGCGAVIAGAAGGAAGATYQALWGNRSGNYRNTWSSGAGAMCPRWRNGSFPPCPPLDLPPILLNKYYREGDGLQYTWSVPHDVEGLRGLFASDANYTALLQTLMANQVLWPTNALPNPWYWAGNEPGVLAPWQFSLVPGEEWRTQYWVRFVLDTYYTLTPDGVPGNSDFGELEAWAVFGCLGLYPLAATPGGTYILGSPCFKNVTLSLPSTPTVSRPTLLNIIAHNFSASSVYVTHAILNGVPLPTPFVNHSTLVGGGGGGAKGDGGSTLEFFLTDIPVVWGTGVPV